MITTSTLQPGELRHHQNIGLFNGVQMSALGTIVGSLVLLVTLSGKFDLTFGLIWFTAINLVYALRFLDGYLFRRCKTAEVHSGHWKRRFDTGLVLGSLAWASSSWALYPIGFPSSQALLVLCICAIAGGSLASLAHDRRALQVFHSCLFIGTLSRLLVDGSSYALILAFFSFVIYVLMLGSGMKLNKAFLEAVRQKLQSQRSNLTLMQTSEQMAGMGYWSWAAGAEHINLSDSLARLLNLDRVELSPDDFFSLISFNDRLRVESIIKGQLDDSFDEAAKEVKLEFKLESQDAEKPRYIRQISRRLTSNDNNCLFGSVQEISDIREAQDKIYRMAYQDALTGLTNRTGFYEGLEEALSTADASGSQLAVLYIDLDDFKGVNDYYGHNHGDEYLVLLARHLKESIGNSHLVARLGGDEFCAILMGPAVAQIESVTAKIFEFCQGPIQILGQLIQPKLSIGIAVYPQHGTTGEELISNADLAMYEAKRSDSRQMVFENTIAVNRNSQLEIENGLRESLHNGAFELWYQPKINAENKSIAGVEALIRWRDRSGKLISPAIFIPIAEHAGLINDIGDWVLNTACEQLRVWNLSGYSFQMAVNVSVDHFSNDGFVADVSNAIKMFDIKAENLEIEITESLSRNPELHLRVCRDLRSLGVKVAIDDFGTGYSSLSVLGQLQVDTLKIDRSFITRLPEDAMSCLMVEKITELALGLGYEIVAEGVETEAQLDFLRSVGCPYIQGFYFSKPLPAAEMTNMLREEFLGNNKWTKASVPTETSISRRP